MKKLFAMALVLCMLLGAVSVASAEEKTTLTMWTFIAQHQEFFEKAAERWNSENPDRPIAVEVTTLGYDDMHNKLKVALQADEGAPDMCDVELGQFPNILRPAWRSTPRTASTTALRCTSARWSASTTRPCWRLPALTTKTSRPGMTGIRLA